MADNSFEDFDELMSTEDIETQKVLGDKNTYEAKMIACGLVDKAQQPYNSFNFKKSKSVVKFFSHRPTDQWRQLIKNACKILSEHPTNAHLCQLFLDLRTQQWEKDKMFAQGLDYVVMADDLEIDRQHPDDKQKEYSKNRRSEYIGMFKLLGKDIYELVFKTIRDTEAKIAQARDNDEEFG